MPGGDLLVFKCDSDDHETSPAYDTDAQELWKKFRTELQVVVSASVVSLLDKYTKQAEALRDGALCAVCSVEAPKQSMEAERPTRGVRLRSKDGTSYSTVSES